jgi:hypothetical protein
VIRWSDRNEMRREGKRIEDEREGMGKKKVGGREERKEKNRKWGVEERDDAGKRIHVRSEQREHKSVCVCVVNVVRNRTASTNIKHYNKPST